MGALFEMLTELLAAVVVAVLAQFGVLGDGAGEAREPSVQRTVLQADSTLPGTAREEDCEEAETLHAV